MRGSDAELGVRRRRIHARLAQARRGRTALHTRQRQRTVARRSTTDRVSAGRVRRLDADRSVATRVKRRARQRARARRNAWTIAGLVAVGPLVWLLWPVKSLFYYIPKWYLQLLLGL